jgi:hypothetical protein
MDAITDAYGGDVRMIDATGVRVHHAVATLKKSHPDRCLGRSRGGLTTKIHLFGDEVNSLRPEGQSVEAT